MPLGKIEKRRQCKHLVVDRAGIDICVIAETRFFSGRGTELMKEIFLEDYAWFGKDSDRKIRGGTGGVGILVRNGIGTCKEIKRSEKSDTIWIEIKIDKEILIVGGVYWSPSLENPEEVLEELEEDIGLFKLQGKVVILGDFNRRIKDAPTVYSLNTKLVFPRNTQDIKMDVIKKQDRLFINAMNANDMFVMNGLDSGADYTFEGNKGVRLLTTLF